MKRQYIRPALMVCGAEPVGPLAASVVNGVGGDTSTPGVTTGGQSQESSSEGTDENTPSDMARFNPWNTWDEE